MSLPHAARRRSSTGADLPASIGTTVTRRECSSLDIGRAKMMRNSVAVLHSQPAIVSLMTRVGRQTFLHTLRRRRHSQPHTRCCLPDQLLVVKNLLIDDAHL